MNSVKQAGNEKAEFWKALQAKGWHLEDNCLYPPNGTFRIEGDADLPLHMVENMYKQMKDRLDKIQQHENFNPDNKQYQNYRRDIEIVINTLKEFLDGKQSI